ncbi:MAG: 5-oxoprolinase subunit PxpB [Bacteroidota bacterium]
MINIVPYGDTALLINFEQTIEPRVNREVVELTHQLEEAHIPGVEFCTPAYCSVTVGFDPELISFDLLKELIFTLNKNKNIKTKSFNSNKKKWRIPVCYDPPFALDLQDLNKQLNISEKEIIRLHTATIYQIYMLGFLPGFAYMGVLPDSLKCTRKENPRLKVPAQSVGLAGLQTGIYPMAAPGGWQIIGRTPISIFNVQNDNPFLFSAGDFVQFFPIKEHEFEKIENAYKAGNYQLIIKDD